MHEKWLGQILLEFEFAELILTWTDLRNARGPDRDNSWEKLLNTFPVVATATAKVLVIVSLFIFLLDFPGGFCGGFVMKKVAFWLKRYSSKVRVSHNKFYTVLELSQMNELFREQ